MQTYIRTCAFIIIYIHLHTYELCYYASIFRVSDATPRGSVVGSVTLVTLCASLDNTCTLVVVVGSM